MSDQPGPLARAHVALNAIAVSVILHVAIGRRWPFTDQSTERPHVIKYRNIDEAIGDSVARGLGKQPPAD